VSRTRIRVAAPGLLLVLAACGSRGQRPADDVSYTTQTSRSTTVTVHPPPPVVSNTRTTSAELRAARPGDTPVNSLAHRDEAPGYGSADAQKTNEIRNALATERALRDVEMGRVRVVALDGRVVLSGYVSTIADKVAIEQRVREVKGVETVANDIQVLR
jgi:hypothetical protein